MLDEEIMNEHTVSIQEEIETCFMQKPHVVILGAGASVAAIPNGDLNGKRIPVMKNLIDILKLDNLIKNVPSDIKNSNFESIYSYLIKNNYPADTINEIEEKVYDHFSQYRLPKTPTL